MRYALLLIVAIATLGMAAQSQPPTPSSGKVHEPPQEKSRTNEQPADQAKNKSPTTINIVRSYTQPKPNGDAAKKESEPAPDLWLDFLTALLVGVGLIQAGIFVSQLRTSKKQLRAYVSVEPGHLAVPGEGDPPTELFEAQPVILNRGQTPAKKCVIKSLLAVHQIPLPIDFDYSVLAGPSPSVTTISPGHHKFNPIFLNGHNSVQEVADIKSASNTRLLVYGDVEYEDVFGGKHTTNFCFYMMWGSKGGAAWVSTPEHNDAD
jgi:hypothetical protein